MTTSDDVTLDLFNPTIVDGPTTVVGFKLTRIELFNWGTFNGKVWSFNLDNLNALLTGANGAGKTTLSDAFLKLMSKSAKVKFNSASAEKAAARTTQSYMCGYYGGQSAEDGKAKPKMLRKPGTTYSVILAAFFNEFSNQWVSIAQVMFMDGDTVKTYFFAEQKNLKIAEHFADFAKYGQGTKGLLAKAKDLGLDCYKHDEYFTKLRQYLGLSPDGSSQELLVRAVSLKGVSSITQFARDFILRCDSLKPHVEQFLEHYEDLDASCQAIIQTEKKIKILSQVKKAHEGYLQACQDLADFEALQHCARPFLFGIALGRCEDEAYELSQSLEKAMQIKQDHTKERENLQETVDTLKEQIRGNGGERITHLQSILNQLRSELSEVEKSRSYFARALQELQISTPNSVQEFENLKSTLTKMESSLDKEEADLKVMRDEAIISKDKASQKTKDIQEQLNSLGKSSSNIDIRNLQVRASLCQDLDLDESDIPFAGEVLKVKDAEAQWQPAIERVMRSFAQTLLVAPKHVESVRQWVDQRKGRFFIAYQDTSVKNNVVNSELAAGRISTKLEISEDIPDSLFYWLEDKLDSSFTHVCVTEASHMGKHKRAVSLAGQVKGGGSEYRMDNRLDYADPSNWLLGWSNTGKQESLNQALAKAVSDVKMIQQRIDSIDGQLSSFGTKAKTLALLGACDSFSKIDTGVFESQIKQTELEMAQLAQSSNVLMNIQNTLEDAKLKYAQMQVTLDQDNAKIGAIEAQIKALETKREEFAQVLQGEDDDLLEAYSERLEKFLGEKGVSLNFTVSQLESVISRANTLLSEALKTPQAQKGQSEAAVARAMEAFSAYRLEQYTELVPKLEFATEWLNILDELENENLPQFKSNFEQRLKDNSFYSLSVLLGEFNNQQKQVSNDIAQVNKIMTSIEYEPGASMRLKEKTSYDQNTRRFVQMVRSAIEASKSAQSDLANQFIKVREFAEAVKSPEKFGFPLDWIDRVTDVRNSFEFAVEIYNRADGSQKDYLEGSSSKSGGQQEKIAMTMLAASFVMQYNLVNLLDKNISQLTELEKKKSYFRMFLLDEAFSHSSPENVEYAMDLFKRCGLQLMILTPMSKVGTLEPYINRFGYVSKKSDETSEVDNVSVNALSKLTAGSAD